MKRTFVKSKIKIGGKSPKQSANGLERERGGRPVSRAPVSPWPGTITTQMLSLGK